MSKVINEYVKWVGKTDWELKKFHGDEYNTINGSSYNSYLIEDEKVVLIDTAWKPFDEEFVENLKKEIDLNKIDYIIANHGEVDHSGSLPKLMKEIPNTPIYCTANGVKSIKGQYHEDWNFVTVKTGDTLNIGKHTLTFIEAPMLHWPDTMFTYMDKEITNEKIQLLLNTHVVEVGKYLSDLVKKEMLVVNQNGRWTTYSINEKYGVSLISSLESDEDLNKTDREILEYLKNNKKITSKDVIKVTNISSISGANKALKRLFDKNLLKKTRIKNSVFYEIKEC